MSNRQRHVWEDQEADLNERLRPIREEWEYQDDADIEYVSTEGDWPHQKTWLGDERDQTDHAYLAATDAYARSDDYSAELRQMPYSQYLGTPHWRTTRRRALLRSGRQCQRCHATNRRLDVHHLTYERRGREAESDLIVLCETCHESEHAKRDAPPESRELASYANDLAEILGRAWRTSLP